jgi:hypothetical protein
MNNSISEEWTNFIKENLFLFYTTWPPTTEGHTPLLFTLHHSKKLKLKPRCKRLAAPLAVRVRAVGHD